MCYSLKKAMADARERYADVLQDRENTKQDLENLRKQYTSIQDKLRLSKAQVSDLTLQLAIAQTSALPFPPPTANINPSVRSLAYPDPVKFSDHTQRSVADLKTQFIKLNIKIYINRDQQISERNRMNFIISRCNETT